MPPPPPRPRRLWLKALFALTNATFAGVLVVEGVEVVSRDRWWVFYTDHPWFIFTATVSVLLSLAQVAVVLAGRTKHHLLFLTADGTWTLLWVLQLVVQALLPASHRAYALETVALMGGLYALQACAEAPVIYYLVNDYNEAAAVNVTSEKEVATPATSHATVVLNVGYARSKRSKKPGAALTSDIRGP